MSWVRVLVLDGVVSGLSWLCAFLIRFDGAVPAQYHSWLLLALPVVVGVRLASLYLCGVYWSPWRFVGVLDLWRIVKGVMLSSVLLGAGALMARVGGMPRSVLMMDGILALTGIGGVRLLYRIVSEQVWRGCAGRAQEGRRLLIVGAGSAGEMLARGLLRPRQQRYAPVGFADDNRALLRKEIHGVRVLGTVEDIPRLVKEHRIEEIAVAIPSASGEAVSRIVDRCVEAGCTPKIVPDAATLIQANGSAVPLRDIEVGDLLRRKPVELDTAEIAACLRDKTVLVTGAAGSIGSELCRQVIGYGPRLLIMFDRSETNLYLLDRELCRRSGPTRAVPAIGDVTDLKTVERVLKRYRPQVVFHAAAYKHVPLAEQNPEETIRNNLGGTTILASLSRDYQVERFVMISTDKAVQPTGIMGVSKRLCELFIHAVSGNRPCRFMTVRFGNVLGSAGSVVPLFQQQIRDGGPVTVTHPDISRYFMTITEAAQLVLQAGTLGQGGELFVLNMGRQVRILDLAERLIRLSGLEPYTDIAITFTGLRPGEKMFERLWIEGEVPVPTVHDKIFVAQTTPASSEQVYRMVNEVLAAAERSDRPAMMQAIRALVPEYVPDLHAGLTVDTRLGSRARILVAHGDPVWVESVERGLGTAYEVTTAVRGDLALEKVFAQGPDVVALGAGLDGLSGQEVCDRIKRHPITGEIPVIMLGAEEEGPTAGGSRKRADLYLTGSPPVPRLGAAVEALLSAAPGRFHQASGQAASFPGRLGAALRSAGTPGHADLTQSQSGSF